MEKQQCNYIVNHCLIYINGSLKGLFSSFDSANTDFVWMQKHSKNYYTSTFIDQ